MDEKNQSLYKQLTIRKEFIKIKLFLAPSVIVFKIPKKKNHKDTWDIGGINMKKIIIISILFNLFLASLSYNKLLHITKLETFTIGNTDQDYFYQFPNPMSDILFYPIYINWNAFL